MRNLLVKIRFVGINYHGFQIQKNAVTVQQVFQEALNIVLGFTPDIKGCSRTDSGVNAYEYAISLKIEDDISCDRLKNALNYHLPKDIRVISIGEVDDEFHARYSCKAKRYRYIIYNDYTMDPFLEGRALQVKKDIDPILLNEAAQCFVGTHDFRPFSGNTSMEENTVRTVYSASFTKKEKIATFLVTADGFLYNMVRIMVGVLLEVNGNRLTKEDILEIFETGIRTRRCITAPAKGLYLDRVFYSFGELDGKAD